MNLFDLMATLGLDSSSYEKGMDNAESSSESFGSKLKNGLTTAAKTAAAALTTVATVTAAAAGAMIKGAAETAAYGDNIDKMSQKMGISATAYQEWDAVMQHSGTSIESLKGSMKTLSTQAEKGNEAFQKLGVTQEDIANLSKEDLFSKVISGLQDMEEGTERTYIASQLLGRGATELGALLNMSAEETQAMKERVHELGGVMSDDAVKSSATFQDNLQDLKTAMSGVKRGITAELLPGLNSLMAGFTSLIIGEEGAEEAIDQGFNELFEGLNSGLDKIISFGSELIPRLISAIITFLPRLAPMGISIIQEVVRALIDNLPQLVSGAISILSALGNALIENGPTLIAAIGDVMNQVIQMITAPDTLTQFINGIILLITTMAGTFIDNIPAIIDAIITIINNLVQVISDNLPTIIQAAVDIMNALIDGLIEALPTLISYVPKIINTIADVIFDNLPTIIDSGMELIEKFALGIIDNLPAIIDAIATIIKRLVSYILEHLPEFMQRGMDLIMAIIQGILNNLPAIMDTIGDLIAHIIVAIVQNLPQILQQGMSIVGQLVAGLIRAIPQIIRALPQLFRAIIDGFKQVDWGEIGRNIIEGIKNGVISMATNLWQAARDAVSNAIQGVKNFLGIRSPSRLFRDQVGKMIGLGMAEGINESAEDVVDSAEDMARQVFDTMDGMGAELATGVGSDFSSAYGQEMGKSGLTASGSGITINVYGAEGQNVNELAEVISQKLAFATQQERLAWA